VAALLPQSYCVRILLADLRAKGGHVNKDTVAGGYGSRFVGTSKTTKVIELFRKFFENVPSIQIGYLAAIFAEKGHEVFTTRNDATAADLALVLTSIVDFRKEVQWAGEFRKKYNSPVGFFGTFATHIPQELSGADFIIRGEPEDAATRLATGESLNGIVVSNPIQDLDSLPFPRWDIAGRTSFLSTERLFNRRSTVPVLSSRSCPEFCTYCPHRITASYRSRSAENVVAELEHIHRKYGKTHFLFRDPLFTEERERSIAIAEGILRSQLSIQFECETRLDDLDKHLLDLLYRAGLRTITFGVESVNPITLKKVGRRPIPPEHQKEIISYCTKKGIRTTGFYVLGFPSDTSESVCATIDYSVELNSTLALYKILTPYPGTPLRKQMESLITETDLQKFDGFTVTFRHPNIDQSTLQFLLRNAYTRFYCRPSWLIQSLGLQKYSPSRLTAWDAYATNRHDKIDAKDGFIRGIKNVGGATGD